MRGGRKASKVPTLTEDNIIPYLTSFKLWWSGLQPDWRRDADGDVWPPSQILPQAVNDWTALRRGGTNGLFVVIMGLAWAYRASSTLPQRPGLVDVMCLIGDVTLVLKQIANPDTDCSVPQSPTKRPRSSRSKPVSSAQLPTLGAAASSSKPASKRRRIT